MECGAWLGQPALGDSPHKLSSIQTGLCLIHWDESDDHVFGYHHVKSYKNFSTLRALQTANSPDLHQSLAPRPTGKLPETLSSSGVAKSRGSIASGDKKKKKSSPKPPKTFKGGKNIYPDSFLILSCVMLTCSKWHHFFFPSLSHPSFSPSHKGITQRWFTWYLVHKHQVVPEGKQVLRKNEDVSKGHRSQRKELPFGQIWDRINDYNPVMDYNTETKTNIHEFR